MAEQAEIAVKKKKSKTREYAEALLTALLVAVILRSFVIEAFKVPSASMLPSILIGDHLFVNKFAYGLRIPLTKKWVARFEDLERGEIAVFIYPRDEGKDFIKRVVALPGDHIVMDGKRLFINEQEVPRVRAVATKDHNSLTIRPAIKGQGFQSFEVDLIPDWQNYEFYIERMGDHDYVVQYHHTARPSRVDITVPKDHFFVIGDNRNRSSDSRDWGFVPLDNLKGRAMFVWLSLDYDKVGIRWDRFGHWIK
jgi:signal peptidase I